MRCKVGDLAWVVQSDDARNIGKVVEVLRPGQFAAAWIVVCRHSTIYGWIQPGAIPSFAAPGSESHARDSSLLPITNSSINPVLREEVAQEASAYVRKFIEACDRRARRT